MLTKTEKKAKEAHELYFGNVESAHVEYKKRMFVSDDISRDKTPNGIHIPHFKHGVWAWEVVIKREEKTV
ncbi:MAG: hypothetical protein ACRENF_02660, partial [Thermodesulfobacteriota bacterium]